MICINSKEKRFLNHVLKNQLVLFNVKERKAKGDNNTKTFIKIYRKE